MADLWPRFDEQPDPAGGGPDRREQRGGAWRVPGFTKRTARSTTRRSSRAAACSSEPPTGRSTPLDAEDGSEIWSTQLDLGEPAFGGGLVGSSAVTKSSVLVAIDPRRLPLSGEPQPPDRKAALAHDDRRAGQVGHQRSEVVFDGLVFVGFFGNADAQEHERGGFALLDAATGELLKRTFVIGDADFAGYAGAGVWCTPAFDRKARLAYVGTSNPHNARMEHRGRTRCSRSTSTGRAPRSARSSCPTRASRHRRRGRRGPTGLRGQAGRLLRVLVQRDVPGRRRRLRRVAEPVPRRRPGPRVGGLQKAGIYHIVDAEGDGRPLRRRPWGCPASPATPPRRRSRTARRSSRRPARRDGRRRRRERASRAGPRRSAAASPSTRSASPTASSGPWTRRVPQRLRRRRRDEPSREAIAGDDTGEHGQVLERSGVSIARGTVYVAAESHVIALRLPSGP